MTCKKRPKITPPQNLNLFKQEEAETCGNLQIGKWENSRIKTSSRKWKMFKRVVYQNERFSITSLWGFFDKSLSNRGEGRLGRRD